MHSEELLGGKRWRGGDKTTARAKMRGKFNLEVSPPWKASAANVQPHPGNSTLVTKRWRAPGAEVHGVEPETTRRAQTCSKLEKRISLNQAAGLPVHSTPQPLRRRHDKHQEAGCALGHRHTAHNPEGARNLAGSPTTPHMHVTIGPQGSTHLRAVASDMPENMDFFLVSPAGGALPFLGVKAADCIGHTQMSFKKGRSGLVGAPVPLPSRSHTTRGTQP